VLEDLAVAVDVALGDFQLLIPEFLEAPV